MSETAIIASMLEEEPSFRLFTTVGFGKDLLLLRHGRSLAGSGALTSAILMASASASARLQKVLQLVTAAALRLALAAVSDSDMTLREL
jgi:hypothetical protein